MVTGVDIGGRLHGGARTFRPFFRIAPVAVAALVLWGIVLVSALRRRTGRRRSGEDGREADALRRVWKTDGRHVLQDDDGPRDHAAINAWITGPIDRPAASPADGDGRSLVYHSLNFDIPFAATRNVRARLLGAVRRRPGADGDIPSQAG